jgi:hypothetical protein
MEFSRKEGIPYGTLRLHVKSVKTKRAVNLIRQKTEQVKTEASEKELTRTVEVAVQAAKQEGREIAVQIIRRIERSILEDLIVFETAFQQFHTGGEGGGPMQFESAPDAVSAMHRSSAALQLKLSSARARFFR